MKLFTAGTKTINLNAIAWIDRKPYEKMDDCVGIVFFGKTDIFNTVLFDIELSGQDALAFLSAIDAIERKQ